MFIANYKWVSSVVDPPSYITRINSIHLKKKKKIEDKTNNWIIPEKFLGKKVLRRLDCLYDASKFRRWFPDVFRSILFHPSCRVEAANLGAPCWSIRWDVQSWSIQRTNSSSYYFNVIIINIDWMKLHSGFLDGKSGRKRWSVPQSAEPELRDLNTRWPLWLLSADTLKPVFLRASIQNHYKFIIILNKRRKKKSTHRFSFRFFGGGGPEEISNKNESTTLIGFPQQSWCQQSTFRSHRSRILFTETIQFLQGCSHQCQGCKLSFTIRYLFFVQCECLTWPIKHTEKM